MSSSVKHGLPGSAAIETLVNSDAAEMNVQPLLPAMQLTFNAYGVSEISYRWQSSADGRSWTSAPGASSGRLLSRQSDHGLSLTLALTYIFIDSAFSADTALAAPLPAFAPDPGDRSDSGQTDEIPSDIASPDNHGSGNSEPSAEPINVGAGAFDGIYDNGGQLLELSADMQIKAGSGVPFFLIADGPALFGNGGLTSVFAGPGENIIQGGDGNDTLFGGDANDTIFGGDGNDTIFGRAGNDTIEGGAGNDLVSGDQGADKVSGDAGADTVSGGDGDDTASGGTGDDEVSGGAGDDMVSGEEGDDKVSGDAGADTVSGGDGDDGASGGTGDDTVYGGSGDDTVYGDSDDGAVFGGSGNDKVYGGAGDDPVFGDSGNDTVSGGDGDDAVVGGSGDDTVCGDAGDDIVSGGSGNDTVSGGTGHDTLYGGSGYDVFIYRYGDGNDSIMDFEDDHDELRFDGDDVTYEVNNVDYGRDYTFKNGQVLAVYSNKGKGSEESGSGKNDAEDSGSDQSGSIQSDSDNSGPDSGGIDGYDDEFDYTDFGNQTVYDSVPGTDGDNEWVDLVATGVYEAPHLDAAPVEDYAPLSDLYNDQGLNGLLGVSTITFSHEDYNLFG